MERIWQRIEAWLEKNAPEIRADLQRGASGADMTKAGRTLSVSLPDDLRQSYRIHDGTKGSGPPLLGEWRLLSLSAIAREWKTLKRLLDDGTFPSDSGDVDEGIKDVWWSAGWIPIASNSAGDFRCVDLDPDEGGQAGQVIGYWHADARRELLAPSFERWLTTFADELEAGAYRIEDGWLTK
jgi:cell wall assembly regulator SMI1